MEYVLFGFGLVILVLWLSRSKESIEKKAPSTTSIRSAPSIRSTASRSGAISRAGASKLPSTFSNAGASSIPSTFSRANTSSQKDQWLDEKMSWLRKTWSSVDENSVPYWYNDKVTERQIHKLESYGLSGLEDIQTKGLASDIIGLFSKPDENDREVLKFFKLSGPKYNQTEARYKVRHLLADSANAENWSNRPATQIQKEFFRFMGIPIPKGLTLKQAEEFVQNFEDENRMEQWLEFEDMWEELSDKEIRVDYSLRKPSMAKFREAWQQTRKSNEAREGSEDATPDLWDVVDALLELDPSLRRD